jgi:hypothetical protein
VLVARLPLSTGDLPTQSRPYTFFTNDVSTKRLSLGDHLPAWLLFRNSVIWVLVLADVSSSRVTRCPDGLLWLALESRKDVTVKHDDVVGHPRDEKVVAQRLDRDPTGPSCGPVAVVARCTDSRHTCVQCVGYVGWGSADGKCSAWCCTETRVASAMAIAGASSRVSSPLRCCSFLNDSVVVWSLCFNHT